MADLTMTVANVVPGTGAIYDAAKLAGEALVQGIAVYLKSDGKYWKSDANVTALTAAAKGITVNSALAGQPITVQTSGLLGLGAILTQGKYYAAARAPGLVCPVEDLTTGDWATILGQAITTSNLLLAPKASGVQI